MTREKLDLGAAFEKFKTNHLPTDVLLDAYVKANVRLVKSDEIARYGEALGILGGTLKAYLNKVANIPMDEVDEEIKKQGEGQNLEN